VNLLRGATLAVRDPDASAARYGAVFDYVVAERGAVSADLAQSWTAPAAAGAPYVVCRPASGAEVFLRFVQSDPPKTYRPLRSFGWAALEICVADVLQVAERLKASPFEIIGPPRALDGMPEIFPMQVRGPDDEIVYLTEIRAQPEGVRLRTAKCLIDRLFIMVLACSDLAATRSWFSADLALRVRPDVDIRYTMLSKAFDLPADTKHRIATAGHDLDVFLEFDQYPHEAEARPGAAGALAAGVSMVTLTHPAFDAVAAPFTHPPQVRSEVLYGGRRAGCVLAPDGTLVELVADG
jgi:hypothetical protein